jgi:hypothetical protein
MHGGFALAFFCLVVASRVSALRPGLRLEGYAYPLSNHACRCSSQQQPIEMVYMSVASEGPPRGVVVLLATGPVSTTRRHFHVTRESWRGPASQEKAPV